MTYANIIYEKAGAIAMITLHRPACANALDLATLAELKAAFADCGADERLRALLITGAGASFCAGWDLPALTQASDARPRSERALFDLLEALGALPQPALAVVNGLAQDAGLALALACDLVLAAPEARFAQGAADGLPDSGCARLLSGLLGRRRAAQLALLPRSLSAQEALGWGLVNRIVPREWLTEQAWAWAEGLARRPWGHAVKRTIHGSHAPPA